MNIEKESLEQEIDYYTTKIGKYETNPEYVDPNCSLMKAREILARLKKEYITNYKTY